MAQLTTKQIQLARDWLSGCIEADAGPEVEIMPANDIEAGIHRLFPGGVPAFVESCNPAQAPSPRPRIDAMPDTKPHHANRANATPTGRKCTQAIALPTPDQQSLPMENTPQTNLFGEYQPTPIKGRQLPLFHQPVDVSIPDTRPEIDKRIARKFDENDTPLMFAEQPAQQSSRGLTLAERVERTLRARAIPYVAVDECKRALFSDTKLKAFHFVVYAPSSDNWLLSCARPTPGHRRDMEKWERVFGEGFRAIFAADRAAGIAYRTLAGDAVKLPGRD